MHGHHCPLQTSAIHTQPDSGPLEVNERTLRDVRGFGAEPLVCKSIFTSSVTQQHREQQEHPEAPRMSGSHIDAGSIFLKHLTGLNQIFLLFFSKKKGGESN